MKTSKLLLVILSIMFVVSCASKTGESVYKDGLQKIKAKEYNLAAKDFKDVIENYPNSSVVALANYELGKLYQGNVIDSLSKVESLNKAIGYYEVVYTEYPEMREAQNALFMTGFIQANELGKYEQAKQTYELFLNTYPKSQLAASAKTELENMGMSAEEILKKTAAQPE